MRRLALLLTAVMLVAGMVAIGALSGVAQEDGSTADESPPFVDAIDAPFFEDAPDVPFFEDPSDEPPSEGPPDGPSSEDGSEQEASLCTPEWMQEWSEWWVPAGDGVRMVVLLVVSVVLHRRGRVV